MKRASERQRRTHMIDPAQNIRAVLAGRQKSIVLQLLATKRRDITLQSVACVVRLL